MRRLVQLLLLCIVSVSVSACSKKEPEKTAPRDTWFVRPSHPELTNSQWSFDRANNTVSYRGELRGENVESYSHAVLILSKDIWQEDAVYEVPANVSDGIVRASLSFTYDHPLQYYAIVTCSKDEDSDLVYSDLYPVPAWADPSKYVDLGLPSGLLWAKYNIGASAPEEGGDYYSWGETEVKDHYYTDNYLFYDGNKRLTKYCSVDEPGFWVQSGEPDGILVLQMADDVCTVKWGRAWRTPTRGQWEELIDNCNWEWTEIGGQKGYRVSSKTNSNSIFLPAVGYIANTTHYHKNEEGYYASANIWDSYPRYFGTTNIKADEIWTNHGVYRYCGATFRAVVRD